MVACVALASLGVPTRVGIGVLDAFTRYAV
jgi:hypothetical protein